METDRKEKLRELYNGIIGCVVPLSIIKYVKKGISENLEVENYFKELENEIHTFYYQYVELVPTDELKHLALTRLKAEFQIRTEDATNIFNWVRERKKERVVNSHLEIDVEGLLWFEICREVERFFYDLTIELINEDLMNLEFELIGATPPPTKSRGRKPKERQNVFNMYESTLMFALLKRHNFFATTNNTSLKYPLSQLVEYDAEFIVQNLNKLGEIRDLQSAHVHNILKLANKLVKELETIKLEKEKEELKR